MPVHTALLCGMSIPAMHFAAAECAAMPDDTVMLVNVPACGLRRPTTFFQKEPTDFNIVRVTEQRRSMSVEARACHTLELANSHPLLLLRVRECEEHNHALAQKRAAAISRLVAKKARGSDPGPDEGEERCATAGTGPDGPVAATATAVAPLA